jgi:hypothetical protein
MYIFRIENDEGVGFIMGKLKYYSHKLDYELEYNNINDEIMDKNGILTERREHPDADYGTPLAKAYFDKLIYTGGPLRFGFATIKDLYTWISPVELGVYELNGYYIHVYDIPPEHIIFGTRQVAFNPIYSTSKTKISHKKLRRFDFKTGVSLCS